MIRRRNKRRSELEPVGQLVPRVLGDLGLATSARVLRLAEHWEEAVGAEVARHCRPTALRDGILELPGWVASVDSSDLEWTARIETSNSWQHRLDLGAVVDDHRIDVHLEGTPERTALRMQAPDLETEVEGAQSSKPS